MRGENNWRGQAFTLVEMLVVLGIMVLLISILLPAVSRARKAAEMTKCLAQLREIGIALSQYVSDNGSALPDAVPTNGIDSPASNHFAAPSTTQNVPYPGALADPGRMPSIDTALDKYLKGAAPRIWRCPSQIRANGQPGFRSGEFLIDDSGYFSPGYMYLGTKDYGWFMAHLTQTSAKYVMKSWLVRNIAGLRMSQFKNDNSSTAEICTFMDYISLMHGKSPVDVYDLKTGQHGAFASNFLFLDGHAETRNYNDVDTLLDQVHKPIRQIVFGADLPTVFKEQYDEK
jgi:prepilin-type processing-associated H-X9-DG protein